MLQPPSSTVSSYPSNDSRNARVAWLGADINLKTNKAIPDASAAAVRKALAAPRYREAAVRIGTAIAASPDTAPR